MTFADYIKQVSIVSQSSLDQFDSYIVIIIVELRCFVGLLRRLLICITVQPICLVEKVLTISITYIHMYVHTNTNNYPICYRINKVLQNRQLTAINLCVVNIDCC